MRSDTVYCGGYKKQPAVSRFTLKMKAAGSSKALASTYLLPPSSLSPQPIFMWFEVSIAVVWYVASNVSEGYTAYIFRVESEHYSHNWEDHNVNIRVTPVCLSR